MMAAVLVLCLLLSLATNVWMFVIIFRRSVPGGALSLVLGFPILYYLVKGWGKEGEDIRVPFFLTIVLLSIATAVGLTSFGNLFKDAIAAMQV